MRRELGNSRRRGKGWERSMKRMGREMDEGKDEGWTRVVKREELWDSWTKLKERGEWKTEGWDNQRLNKDGRWKSKARRNREGRIEQKKDKD